MPSHFTLYINGQAVTATNLNNRLTEISDYLDDMLDGTVPFPAIDVNGGTIDGVSLSMSGGDIEGVDLSADLIALGASTILTINSGAVTVTKSYHAIAAQTGTADDLDTITAAETRTLLLIKADTGDTITVKHNTGNIKLQSGQDVALSGDDALLLFWDGTSWIDLNKYIEGLTGLNDVSAAAQTANFVMAAGDGATGGDYRGRALVRADLPTTTFHKRNTMWHDEAIVIAGNALTHGLDAAHRYATLSYQNVAANADAFENAVYLRAGTYTLTILGQTNTNCGKIDWYLKTDGGAYGAAFSTGQDWYSAALTRNVIKTVAGVAIATDGYYVLKGVVNGKNGSSSAYNIPLTKYHFAPASY